MRTMERILGAVGDYSKVMATLHTDYLKLVERDLKRFMEMSGDLKTQMQWQAGTAFALTAISASLAIAGSLIPKGADPASTTLNNPRLGANDGIGDNVSQVLNSIGEKLRDSEFLRQTCKTSAKFFGGLPDVTNTLYRGQTTQSEAKREITQTCFREGQQNKSSCAQEDRRAQESALAILQSKSKSG